MTIVYNKIINLTLLEIMLSNSTKSYDIKAYTTEVYREIFNFSFMQMRTYLRSV
jgi:hypothetical protein